MKRLSNEIDDALKLEPLGSLPAESTLRVRPCAHADRVIRVVVPRSLRTLATLVLEMRSYLSKAVRHLSPDLVVLCEIFHSRAGPTAEKAPLG